MRLHLQFVTFRGEKFIKRIVRLWQLKEADKVLLKPKMRFWKSLSFSESRFLDSSWTQNPFVKAVNLSSWKLWWLKHEFKYQENIRFTNPNNKMALWVIVPVGWSLHVLQSIIQRLLRSFKMALFYFVIVQKFRKQENMILCPLIWLLWWRHVMQRSPSFVLL